MSALGIPQYELFCRECVELLLEYAVEGANAVKRARDEAYKRAGFAPNSDNARRFANRPQIKARVSELFNEALEYRDVRVASVLTRIDRVGRANVVDFYDQNLKIRNINDLPRELTEAIKAIKFKDGEIGIELWDKNQANFTLLKHLGGLPEDRHESRTVNIFTQLSVDDQRALAEALEALPGGASDLDLEAAGEHRAA
jgi:hypothetical protein